MHADLEQVCMEIQNYWDEGAQGRIQSLIQTPHKPKSTEEL